MKCPKPILLLLFCITSSGFTQTQVRFVNADDADFYEWFHSRSQIADLYAPGTNLIVFADEAPVFSSATASSETVARLTLGAVVRNESDYRDQLFIPQAEVNGYLDNWYEVSGRDDAGKTFRGYIWGGYLAKGWRNASLTGAQRDDLILLGVSQKKRTSFTDISAEIRVLQGRQLIAKTLIPGLCVFEECQSTPLLRAIPGPVAGQLMIEASTMTVGCLSGTERAFLYWDGSKLQCAYHAEYTVNRQYVNKSFQVRNGGTAMVCRYNGIDRNFEPVWDCKPASKPATTAKAAVAAAKPKA